MRETQRKVRRFVWLGVLLFFLVSNANGCALMMNMQKKRDPNAPKSVVWDLSRSNGSENLDEYTRKKFARLQTDTTAYQDGIHLKLLLPNGKALDEDLDTVFCTLRDGKLKDGKVEDIKVHFPTMTIEEIQRTGDRLIKYWNFERRNFDDWCRERRGFIPEDDDRLGMDRNFHSRRRSEEQPSLSMGDRMMRSK
jgi:hypothetical protein